MAAPIRLEFVVWQFVRLMVEFDGAPGGRRRSVADDWRAAWHELDGELARRGARDADAFADLMMNQVVVVEARDADQLAETVAALDRVTAQLAREIRQTKDRRRADDLRFEEAELAQLRRRLARREKRARRDAA